jgi:hypothetical protein
LKFSSPWIVANSSHIGILNTDRETSWCQKLRRMSYTNPRGKYNNVT